MVPILRVTEIIVYKIHRPIGIRGKDIIKSLTIAKDYCVVLVARVTTLFVIVVLNPFISSLIHPLSVRISDRSVTNFLPLIFSELVIIQEVPFSYQAFRLGGIKSH